MTAVIEEAFRFADEDTLVFRVRLENRGREPQRYAPAQLGVRVAGTEFPVALTDAPGVVPAGQASLISVIITGHPDGDRGDLSLQNVFAVLVRPTLSIE
jgi:hypothetical protein